MVLLILAGSLVHASAEDAPPPNNAASEDSGDAAVTRDELRAVMSESVDPGRLNRTPGLSPIVVAPRPGEHPTTGKLNARKDEEPAPGGLGSPRYLDFSDQLSAQPGEPSVDQR